jgi:hypothetical protein
MFNKDAVFEIQAYNQENDEMITEKENVVFKIKSIKLSK